MTTLLNRIEAIVGPAGLVTGDEARQRPGDWLGRSRCNALAIVRPANTSETADVLKLCNSEGQPVVAAGGMTGLVQGAATTEAEILLSFERMTAIEEIDATGRTMTVQAGAPMQKAQEAALEHGLIYPVDLGARGSATIGGNISTNAGGNQVIRYGMTRQQVLGLEAVLADGTVLSSMNKVLKNNSGYDLKQLFIGTEGTLGLVTRAVLRLQPCPKSQNTALLAIDDFAGLSDVFRFCGDNFADTLTAFEVMWKEHYDIVAVNSGRHTPPLPAGHGYYVIVETAGADEDRDSEHFTTVLGDAIERGLVADAVIAGSKAQRHSIWAIREDIEAIVGAIMPGAVFDISLPITEMEVYVNDIRSAVEARWPGENLVVVFGHLGDGNLHIGVRASPWSDEAHHAVEEIVYRPLAAFGGAISAEHGVGLEKRAYLGVSRSADEIALMRRLKQALDPNDILNRGKVLGS